MPNRFNDALPEDDHRKDGKVECAQCQSLHNPEDCALLDGKYLCSFCLDPNQSAFDLVVSIVEQQDATIQGLKCEVRNLRYELRVAKGRAA